MFSCHVKAPRLLHELRQTTRGAAMTQKLLDRTLKLREEALALFERFSHVLQVLSVTPIEHRPTVEDPAGRYDFQCSFLEGFVFPGTICSHYSLLILLNEALSGLGGPCSDGELKMEMRHAAIEIAKCVASLEDTPITILGIFTLAYLPFYLESALRAPNQPYLGKWLRAKSAEWTT